MVHFLVHVSKDWCIYLFFIKMGFILPRNWTILLSLVVCSYWRTGSNFQSTIKWVAVYIMLGIGVDGPLKMIEMHHTCWGTIVITFWKVLKSVEQVGNFLYEAVFFWHDSHHNPRVWKRLTFHQLSNWKTRLLAVVVEDTVFCFKNNSTCLLERHCLSGSSRSCLNARFARIT